MVKVSLFPKRTIFIYVDMPPSGKRNEVSICLTVTISDSLLEESVSHIGALSEPFPED